MQTKAVGNLGCKPGGPGHGFFISSMHLFLEHVLGILWFDQALAREAGPWAGWEGIQLRRPYFKVNQGESSITFSTSSALCWQLPSLEGPIQGGSIARSDRRTSTFVLSPAHCIALRQWSTGCPWSITPLSVRTRHVLTMDILLHTYLYIYIYLRISPTTYYGNRETPLPVYAL